jgi:glycosyltransferase involved in cell wall biosynthesis
VKAGGPKTVDVLAWRDLEDPEAGGSEQHAHRVVSRWAEAGVDVTLWSSRVDGGAGVIHRDGYTARRRAGRYAVFPRTAIEGLTGRIGAGDAVVEIWNGMPFFTPAWSRRPRVVVVHHVHDEMWAMVLRPGLARLGHTIEHRLAPPFYRRSPVITLSESAKAEIVERLGLRPDRVTVVPPGVDPAFSPGGRRDTEPLVVAVGRLVPVKRFDRLIDTLVALRRVHGTLRAVIVGEGYERPALEAQIRAADAASWLTLPGRMPDHELVTLYRRAWLVMSTSVREGWGMTLTEAGACGVPAVATRIAGHTDAVVDGESGILADTDQQLVAAADTLLSGDVERRRMGAAALERAASLSWDATALAAYRTLAEEVARRRRTGGPLVP